MIKEKEVSESGEEESEGMKIHMKMHRYIISLQLKPTITKALPFQWLRQHYTAIIKAVRVLSIFYLKGGTSSKRITWYWLIMAINLWSLLLSAKETHKKAQKHIMQLHSHDIAVTHFWDGNALVQYLARHGCSTDLAWYHLHWQVKRFRPSWFGASSLYQSKLGQHGTAQLDTMLAHFGHVYTATANHAEPCWYCAGTDTVLARFQVVV